MKIPDILGLSIRSVRRNKLRTVLTMLSVTIGIASLTVLNSIGDATRSETVHRFKNMLGTFDTVIIRPGGAKNRGMVSVSNTDASLTAADADAIGQDPLVRQVAQVQNAFDIDIKYRDRAETAGVFGVSANWPALRGDQVASGEFIDDSDNAALARVAVIGADVQAKLFPNEDPLGKTIRIGAVPFVIKGVLSVRGAGPTGTSLDNVIMIPVTTASKRLFNRSFLTMLIAQLKDPSSGDSVIGQLQALLRQRHHLSAGALDDFTVTSPRAVMAQIMALGSTFQTLLSIIAALATSIGGVVIMIVSLIGVAARQSEVGIRRAVGATRQDILLQFLGEAVVVALAGGLLGILLGIGGTQIVSAIQHLPFLIDPSAIMVAIGSSALVGIVFGVYPALRAANTDPIEALRS